MGSRAGIPNKNKQALIALLEAKYPGYHPVVEMAKIANNDLICDVCNGTGKQVRFIGVEITDIKEESRYTDEPCEHCVQGKQIVTMDMRFSANKEVAQYVTPKLKALEQTTELKGNLEHSLTWKYVD